MSADVLFKTSLCPDLSIWQACVVFRRGYYISLIRILANLWTKGHSGES